ncbi:MAG: NDP-sugar synthase [Actinobacteria bacterium]|nr:NDP-sugar synthase [Actinomycetota bacterium]NBQ59830.1 NDP-sugar synthase [Actinomycetota bacterium]NBY83050.1 NDP-sugar synthase [Actinomycetota bacterium]NCU78003.1 NDP-sugar synthase [Actinomycetota bacterium]NCU96800.1 NDP-sugar synthase [Actinomycetota bacterium]
MKISAILLVGGKGTRLMPLTQHTPKPMLEVAGVPFTEHQIRKAAKAGISEIVLATSYKAELFEPYFGDGEKFGIKIKYAVETTALGTGGGIKNAAELLDACDQVVVFNGDVLSGHDLSNQINFHQRNNADVTLYLTEVLDARAYGCVEIDKNNRVKSFLEKMDNPISNLINAGCYIFNPAIINTIPKGQVVSVERETFPNLIATNAKIFGFIDNSYWLDIGTPAALVKASADLVIGKIESAATPEHKGEVLISNTAQISPTALIKNGSVLGSEVVVGSRSEVSGSIIGKGAKISDDCKIIDSIIAPNTQISAGMLIFSNYLGF